MKTSDLAVRDREMLSLRRSVLSLIMLVTLGSAVCLGQQPRSYWTVQESEQLPPPLPPQNGQMQPMQPPIEGCPPAPQDTALSALTADTTLFDRNGQPVTGDRLPPNCASQVFSEVQVPPAMGCDTCEPSLCELLQLAWFCHTPLYFEESLLERHGICSCYCQPLSSACHFYGTVLLLPAKMSHKCLCSCVSSAHPCD